MRNSEQINEVKIIEPYGFIYITTNLVNGKKYIGQKKFYKGWKHYLGSGKLLKNAINKYGKENFIREIIFITYSKEETDKLEIEYIKNHNAVESNNYYNIGFGGNGYSLKGRKVSEETRKMISLAQKGKIISDETRIKMSESHKGEKSHMYGKKKSKEIKEKLSISKLGERNPNFNKKFSKEHRDNISKAQIKLTKEQIIEIRKKYSMGKYTLTELAKEYLVSYSVVRNVVNFIGVYKNII